MPQLLLSASNIFSIPPPNVIKRLSGVVHVTCIRLFMRQLNGSWLATDLSHRILKQSLIGVITRQTLCNEIMPLVW